MKKSSRIRLSQINYLVNIALAASFLFTASHAIALADKTIFGPERYDRLKGEPTVYTGRFERCIPADQAILKIQNGDSNNTRIKAASIRINGNEVINESEFKQQIPLIEKTILMTQSNELRVELKSGRQDDPNNRLEKDQSFLLIEIIGKGCDVTPPTISIPEPADGSLLNISRPRIAAQYVDDPGGTGIDSTSARILLDGKDVIAFADVSAASVIYTPLSALPEGFHNVQVSVSDKAHNSTSFSWSFKTDTVPPKVVITSHQDQQYLNQPLITLSGSIDDQTADVTVNGRKAEIAGGTFSLTDFALTEGPNIIIVEAKDPAGNIGRASITINLDTVPPVVTITSPLSGPTNTNTPNLSYTVSDGTVVVTVDSNIVSKTSGSSLDPLSDGAHTVRVEATDVAGNFGFAEVSFTVATTPETSLIMNPSSSDGLNGWFKTIPAITLTSNQTGTTYYRWGAGDYANSRQTQEWIDGGTPLNIRGDDIGNWYSLPFIFTFYGQDYSQVYVSSNGLISFNGADAAYYNTASAFVRKVAIAPLWDDLRTDARAGDDIYVFQPDPDSIGFRWQAQTYYGYDTNFEVILCRNGRIRFNYGSQAGNLTPTIGISKGDGTSYQIIYDSNISSTNNMNSIIFAPGTWTTYSGPFIGASGESTLYYYSANTAGGVEEIKSQSFKIDVASPTGTMRINNGATYANSPTLALSLTCQDTVSGCALMEFSNDNNTWSDPENVQHGKKLDSSR